MKYQVIIGTQAKQDLREIYYYVLNNDSEESAVKLLKNIENTMQNLEKLPLRRHIPEELKTTGIKRFLEIHYKPYRIIYEIVNQIVYVHCILDGRQNMQELLANRFLR